MGLEIRGEERGMERLLGAGTVVFLDLGGDYVGVHSAIIPLALLLCVVYSSVCRLYFIVKKRNKEKKNHELWRSQAWVGILIQPLSCGDIR